MRRPNRTCQRKPASVQSPTDDYIRKMAGITGTNGKLLKVLLKEKAAERRS
jgi:hypothetical protein